MNRYFEHKSLNLPKHKVSMTAGTDLPLSSDVCHTDLKNLTQHSVSYFGLPYQDHNYGAPPPPTPPQSPPHQPTSQQPVMTIAAEPEKIEKNDAPEEGKEEVLEHKDEGITRCICEYEHDDGYMICCDKCLVWQHVECLGLDRTNIPENYFCELCEPREVDVSKAKELQSKKKKRLEELQKEEEDKNKSLKPPCLNICIKAAKKKNKKKKRKRDREKEGVDMENPDGKRKKKKVKRDKEKMSEDQSDEDDAPSSDDMEDTLEDYEDSTTIQYSPQVEKLLAKHRKDPEVFSAGAAVFHGSPEELKRQKASVLNVGRGGSGLVSRESIPANHPIAKLCGTLILRDKNASSNHRQPEPCTFIYSNFCNTELLLDARSLGSISRFTRKSCSPNAELRHMIIDGMLQLYLFALKDIGFNTEITLGFDFDYTIGNHPVKCVCGRKTCPVKRHWQRYKGTTIRTNQEELEGEKEDDVKVKSPTKKKVSPLKLTLTKQPSVENINIKEEENDKPDTTEPEETNEPPEEQEEKPKPKHKMTREERKMDAIMKAFEKMEKMQQRRQQALERLAQGKDQHTTPSGQTDRQDGTIGSVIELKDEVKASNEESTTKEHDGESATEVKGGDEISEVDNSKDNSKDDEEDVVGDNNLKNEVKMELTQPETEVNGNDVLSAQALDVNGKDEGAVNVSDAIGGDDDIKNKGTNNETTVTEDTDIDMNQIESKTLTDITDKDGGSSPQQQSLEDQDAILNKAVTIKATSRSKSRKKKKSSRKRSRTNSGASSTTTVSVDVSSADECSNQGMMSAGSVTPNASVPSTPLSIQTSFSIDSENSMDALKLGSPAANSKHFKFPKTKRFFMNEWLNEKAFEASADLPLTVKTESCDAFSTLNSPTNSAQIKDRSSSLDFSFGSAKKRWLRQAMKETSRSGSGSNSPICNGTVSPSHHISPSPAVSPNSSSNDFMTPLKKRMLRHSLAEERPFHSISLKIDRASEDDAVEGQRVPLLIQSKPEQMEENEKEFTVIKMEKVAEEEEKPSEPMPAENVLLSSSLPLPAKKDSRNNSSLDSGLSVTTPADTDKVITFPTVITEDKEEESGVETDDTPCTNNITNDDKSKSDQKVETPELNNATVQADAENPTPTIIISNEDSSSHEKEVVSVKVDGGFCAPLTKENSLMPDQSSKTESSDVAESSSSNKSSTAAAVLPSANQSYKRSLSEDFALSNTEKSAAYFSPKKRHLYLRQTTDSAISLRRTAHENSLGGTWPSHAFLKDTSVKKGEEMSVVADGESAQKLSASWNGVVSIPQKQNQTEVAKSSSFTAENTNVDQPDVMSKPIVGPTNGTLDPIKELPGQHFVVTALQQQRELTQFDPRFSPHPGPLDSRVVPEQSIQIHPMVPLLGPGNVSGLNYEVQEEPPLSLIIPESGHVLVSPTPGSVSAPVTPQKKKVSLLEYRKRKTVSGPKEEANPSTDGIKTDPVSSLSSSPGNSANSSSNSSPDKPAQKATTKPPNVVTFEDKKITGTVDPSGGLPPLFTNTLPVTEIEGKTLSLSSEAHELINSLTKVLMKDREENITAADSTTSNIVPPQEPFGEDPLQRLRRELNEKNREKGLALKRAHSPEPPPPPPDKKSRVEPDDSQVPPPPPPRVTIQGPVVNPSTVVRQNSYSATNIVFPGCVGTSPAALTQQVVIKKQTQQPALIMFPTTTLLPDDQQPPPPPPPPVPPPTIPAPTLLQYQKPHTPPYQARSPRGHYSPGAATSPHGVAHSQNVPNQSLSFLYQPKSSINDGIISTTPVVISQRGVVEEKTFPTKQPGSYPLTVQGSTLPQSQSYGTEEEQNFHVNGDLKTQTRYERQKSPRNHQPGYRYADRQHEGSTYRHEGSSHREDGNRSRHEVKSYHSDTYTRQQSGKHQSSSYSYGRRTYSRH